MERSTASVHVNDPCELDGLEEFASIVEIQMMFGRYVTLLDQMDAMAIYRELMATDEPKVSVEYMANGCYVGPEHTRLFFEDLHKKLNGDGGMRGWMDFTNGVTPNITIDEGGTYAWASWLLFSPKAKQASPIGSSGRKLTAFWDAGKMYWELVKMDGKWKILHLHHVSFFTAPYDVGWVKQSECWRPTPLWDVAPDACGRHYAYNPDRVYVKDGQYAWGPYVPEQ